ncbi:MAG: NUDIX hydrolase [Thaumarchaeota archaeon]|nr:NUDIX hydrolase [Nitrososphaerota archaeon]
MPNRREYPEHPLVGVGGLIQDEGSILLIKRKFEPNKGKWSLPGGLLETGEDPEEGARREVREELGLEVKVEGFFSLANEVIRDDRGQVKYHFILLDYLMRQLGGEITLNEESEEFRWFQVGEVERLDTTENTKIVARKLLKVLQNGDQSLR